MPLNVKIRTANINDIDSLLPLLEQLFAIEKDFIFNPEKQSKGLHLMLDGCGKHRTVKVACIDNKIVGMCTAQTRISTASGTITAVVEDLIVNKGFRNHGDGSALLDAMEEWAIKKGISMITLLADMENKPALAFYKTHYYIKTQLLCLKKKLL